VGTRRRGHPNKRSAAVPRLLCGVLNTPHRELPDSEVISFARDSRARLRPERGSERDEAELGVVARLRELGYRDAFRSLHGYAHREPSWTWRRIAGHDGGWRLDHLSHRRSFTRFGDLPPRMA
jgi:exonuclease III